MSYFGAPAKTRFYGERVKLVIPKDLGKTGSNPLKVIVKKRKGPSGIESQPIPLHDFINFKKMSGNEVLLNLDNCDNLRSSELVSGLIELGYRDKEKEHDWNNHPITVRCFKELRRRISNLNSKNIIQTAMILDRLNFLD